MIRWWLALAGLGGLGSVAAGAAAAHLAKNPHAAELLRTGAAYGIAHAAALAAVAALTAQRPRPGAALAVAGWGFALGVPLFSFSLFGLALGGDPRLALVTPFGGGALLVGWLALFLASLGRG